MSAPAVTSAETAGGAHPHIGDLQAWQTVRVVAGREISVKLHDKAFIASTLFLLVVIVLATVVPIVLGGRVPQIQVAVVGAGAEQVVTSATELGQQAQADNSSAGTPFGLGGLPAADVESQSVGSAADARELVAAGSVDAAVLGDDVAALEVVGEDAVPAALLVLIRAAAAELQVSAAADAAGLGSAEVQALLSPLPPTTVLLDGAPESSVPPQLLVLIFAFLFFMSVLTFGMSIAQSVVEEKQSRVVELLVAAVPVRWLLAGKMLGNTALAVGQIVLLLGVGLAGAAIAGQRELVQLVVAASGWFLLFFVLGFVMLACLWAVAGSLASRVEDLQSTTVVMQVFVMIPFFAAIFATEAGPVQTFLSYFPLTAPLLMPERVMLGNTYAWEPLLSAAIVLVTAVVFVLLGSRLYEGSVLHTSARLKVWQAWHAQR